MSARLGAAGELEEIKSHWPNVSFITDLAQLPETLEAVKRSVFLGQGLSPLEVVTLALERGVWHIAQESGGTLTSEVSRAAELLGRPDALLSDPMSAVLGRGSLPAQSFLKEFQGSPDKGALMNDVKAFLRSVPGGATVFHSALRIADEFFMNAVFDAPKRKLLDTGPTQALSRAAKLALAHDEKSLVVCCTDYFGTLEILEMLARIRACYQNGVAESIRQAGAGAGIGMFSVFDLSAGFYVEVQAGQQTTVCARLPLRMSHRALIGLPKSLHLQIEAGEKTRQIRQ